MNNNQEIIHIKDVCRNPDEKNFLKLQETTKKFFNKASRLCLKKSVGNVEFAKKIIRIFSLTTLDKNNIYEINSVLKSIKFLDYNSKISVKLIDEILEISKKEKYYIFSDQKNSVKINIKDMDFFMFEFFKTKKIQKIIIISDKTSLEFFNNSYGINYKDIVNYILNNIYKKFRNDDLDIEKLVEYKGTKIKFYTEIYYSIAELFFIDQKENLPGVLEYIHNEIENENNSCYLSHKCFTNVNIEFTNTQCFMKENNDKYFLYIYDKFGETSKKFENFSNKLIENVKKCKILTVFFFVKNNNMGHAMVLFLNYTIGNNLVMYMYDPNGGNSIFYEELIIFSNKLKNYITDKKLTNDVIIQEYLCRKIHFLPKEYTGKGYCAMYGLFFVYCLFTILEKIDIDILKLIKLIEYNILEDPQNKEESFFKMIVNFSLKIKQNYLLFLEKR